VAPSRFQLQSVGELQARIAAERAGVPFLVFRDGAGCQQIVGLPEGADVPLGRVPGGGIALDWDPEVSRVHAVLERVGGCWFLTDDNISRNGTFVNGARVHGRRRLDDGDVIRCGSVELAFHDPSRAADAPTLKADDAPHAAARLSPAQRRVVAELCRPLIDDPRAAPATNKEIATALVVSQETVKSHLRAAAEAFDLDALPQNEKRLRLAWAAMESGAVAYSGGYGGRI
jgi:pSer/pThr/pTyr-binding forkhead associated (FHA) protein